MKGIIASKGIVIGKTFRLDKAELIIDRQASVDRASDIRSYEEACIKSIDQLERLYNQSLEKLGDEKAQVFKAHQMMLNDPMLNETVLEKIEKLGFKAEAAVYDAVQELVSVFKSLDDEYMRERAHDLEDVANRLLHNIKGIAIQSLGEIDEKVILVADDLTPSDTVEINKDYVLGFVTKEGGKTSHTAILARTLDIPALVGVGDALDDIKSEENAVLDCETGTLHIEPTPELIKSYSDKIVKIESYKKELLELRELRAVSKDGKAIELCCNIGNSDDIGPVVAVEAEGIGLFRTEFLFMNRDSMPTEEEQFAEYKKVVSAMKDKPTIIRTLDIGGDKDLAYFNIPAEENPFLGWRALRICLDQPEIFKTQLRAILRASVFGKTRIMFPMVISVEEVVDAKVILEQCKRELEVMDIAFDQSIELGIMIETPAAVIMAEELIQELDFFSIGTNDLTQYTLAVDRGNKTISKLYEPLNPAVLRSIKRVVEASHKYGKWTGMCGEFAGDLRVTKLLLGLGLDELSMSHSSILEVKKEILDTDIVEATKMADDILKLKTAREIVDQINGGSNGQ